MTDTRPLLALTIGDPAGIGPEIVAKGPAERAVFQTMRPLVIGDARLMETVVKGCRLDLELRAVDRPDDVQGEPGTIEILDLNNIQHHEFGVLDAAMGKAALAYIETACRLALDGSVQGIVTAPINKEAIKAAGSTFPGHTEMLASLLGIAEDRVFTLFVL